MLDHIGIPVSDVARSKQFFVAALAPLGYKVIMDLGEAVGMGAEAGPDFWFGKAQPGSPSHIAFSASDRSLVDAFYRAAIAAGGRDNGKPSIARSTIRTTTARSCSIPTATTSRSCAVKAEGLVPIRRLTRNFDRYRPLLEGSLVAIEGKAYRRPAMPPGRAHLW
jgi:hypothetical protein